MRNEVDDLLEQGKLQSERVDGVTYIWPRSRSSLVEPPLVVRFLAPFDPLVWDRGRFEHYWGWRYRFEAYTPKAKRVRGYYAMPLLFGDDVIGWANIEHRVTKDSPKLDAQLGFIKNRPKSRRFRSELEAEVARMEKFLGVTH